MTNSVEASQQAILNQGLIEIINLSANEHDVEFIVIENQAIRENVSFGKCLKIVILPKNMMTRF